MSRLVLLFLIVTSFGSYCCTENNTRANNDEELPLNWDHKNKHFIRSHVVRENAQGLSSRPDLLKVNQPHHDYIHELVFVVRQRNIDALTNRLHDISDPLSSRYGQHWTREEVADFTSNPIASDAILSYLRSNGVFAVSETMHGEFITASASIALWEKVLYTKFYIFHQIHDNGLIGKSVRTEKYWIPKDLDMNIESILNTIDVFMAKNNVIRKLIPLSNINIENESITPSKLRNYYNISNRFGGNINSTQGIATDALMYYDPNDIVLFQNFGSLSNLSVTATATNVSTIGKGSIANNSKNFELSYSSLQYMMAISPLSPSTLWYTYNSFSTWLTSLVGKSSGATDPLFFQPLT